MQNKLNEVNASLNAFLHSNTIFIKIRNDRANCDSYVMTFCIIKFIKLDSLFP